MIFREKEKGWGKGKILKKGKMVDITGAGWKRMQLWRNRMRQPHFRAGEWKNGKGFTGRSVSGVK